MADLDIDTIEIRELELEYAANQIANRHQAKDAVRKAAFEIERLGKADAPVDTGFLRNSITTTFTEPTIWDSEAEIGPEANYGAYVELGTERQAPQPYLGPAFDAVEPSFAEALAAISPLGGTP